MTTHRCDVLIIGAGAAGLTAAARLVHAGLKVTVVERLRNCGGRFGCIEYEGFKLSTGAVVVPVGGRIEEAWHLVDADFAVREPDPQFTYLVHGQKMQLPGGGAMRRLVQMAAGDAAEADQVWGAIKQGISWAIPPATSTFDEWLVEHGARQSVRDLFQAIVGTWLGINSYELPAPIFFHYLQEVGHMRGFGWAAGGPGALIQKLVEALKERGAEVWTRAAAQRINVAGTSVTGADVQVDDETRHIVADFVLSTVGPRQTAALVGMEHLDAGYRKLLDGVVPFPVTVPFIASDRPLLDDPGTVVVVGAPRIRVMCQLTNLCPELAPPGQHLLEAYAVPADSVEFDPREEQRRAVEDLRALLPGFDRHARVLKVSNFRGNFPGGHAWPGHDIPSKTPVKHLYSIGDGHKPLGWQGIEAVAESARLAVADLLTRAGARTAVS